MSRTGALRGTARRPTRRALGWLALLGPFFYLSYGLANHLASRREAVPSIVFEWERGMPFWAWTIFPYWSINAFYALSLLLARTRHELDRHAARLLTAQVAAVACFIAMPLAFSFGQPPAEGAAGMLFAALRGFDKPFNQAPSLHIALAVILWDFYHRRVTAGWARGVLHLWTFLICASVLTTYQHHFIDIPTGALLGLLCVWAWPLERRLPPWAGARWTREPRQRRLAGVYMAGAVVLAATALAGGGAALWLFWPAAALALVALNHAWLGPRGFGKHGRDGTAWAARWLLAPYRAGVWLNSRAWTRGEAPAVAVADGVWLGRVPGRAGDRQWGSEVNVAAEIDAPPGLPTVHLPAIDLVPPTPRWLRRAAAAIEAQRQRHGSVLVCCALGYSRSAAAVAAWLLRTGRAPDADQAIAVVRAVRPQVVLGPAHVEAIVAAGGDR